MQNRQHTQHQHLQNDEKNTTKSSETSADEDQTISIHAAPSAACLLNKIAKNGNSLH